MLFRSLLVLGGFTSDGSPPLRVIHLCRNRGRRVKFKANEQRKKRDDGLTLTGAFFVLNRRSYRLRSVAVPMDGVEVD